MVPLTSCSEVTSRMQLISNSTQDEARICVPDDEKLLNQTSGSSVEVFSAIYERKRPDILGLDKVGVCFLSSSRSTADETCYNSLYLSRLLFGLEVIGIHNTQRYEITSPSLPNSLVLQSLLTIWDRYFTDYPNGRMIQCCYGDGSVVVQHALKDSSHKGRVVVLGINTYTPIAHKCSYLYHSLGNLFAMPQGISLPFSPNSQSLFLRRLTDPVFVPCFLHVLYLFFTK